MKEIAFTFDDSPRFAKGHLDGPTRAAKLIAALVEAEVKESAFFSVSSRLDAEGRRRLESYSGAGHIIANHSHAHLDLNQTKLADFARDFKEAHSALCGLPNFEKWFRFPFLREGDQLGKREGMRRILEENGYKNAYVTIINFDWHMDLQFQHILKRNVALDLIKFKTYYVSTLVSAVEYYDRLANQHLGRSPKHVMLLHETDINALFIADFVGALRAKKWRIISPREAFEDDICRHSSPSLHTSNPGRIAEIANLV